MKRILTVLLAVLLLLPASFAAAAEKESAVISFEQLGELVAASNPDMASLRQSYEAQRLALKEMEAKHRDLMDSSAPLESIAAVAAPLQKEISALEIVLAYEESELARALRQQVYLAQNQYLAYYVYEFSIEAAKLELESSRQALSRARAQYAAGYAAYAAVEAAEFAVKDWESALLTLEQRQSANLNALAATVGIAAEFSLAGLPELDLSGIPERKLEADLEAYRLGAPGVRRAALALEEAERALKASSNQGTRYAVQAAKENLALAQALAEREFPQVYEVLLQSYNDYMDQSNLERAEKHYLSMQRQYELGLVSANQAAEAKQALETEKLERRKQALEVFTELLAYELNLDYPKS